MRPILLIMWTAFQCFILRHNDNNNNNNSTKIRKLLNLHKMLLPKADVERLYISRKDGGRGLIEVETAFKTTTMGLHH